MLGYYQIEKQQNNSDCQTPPSFPRTSNSDIKINKEREDYLHLEPVNNSEHTRYNSRVKEPARYTNREPVHSYRDEEESRRARNTYREENRRDREPIYTYREDEGHGHASHSNWEPANRHREVRGKEPTLQSNMSNFQDSSPRHQYNSPRQPFQQYGQTHHHQQQYEQRPQQYEQNPNQQYEQRTYRSGRPDLGNENFEGYSVPYPQEPIRHRQNYYEPPPEIGYDPQGGQGLMRPHPGWVLLLRFSKDGEMNVRRALTFAAKHIESDGGRILGLARSHSVRIREGGDSWVTFGGLRYFGGGNWDVQQAPTQNDTTYSVLAIYYPSLSRAIQWFDRDSCFKQKDFPPPYTTDCIALPLNSSVDTKYCKTLVLTEYPRISHPEYFRDKFSIPTQEMMSKRFNATPYVVKATSIPTDDPRQRVARHLRGSWIKRNSIITLSLFGSLNETHRYFTDPEYMKCKEAQDRVSAPTTVIMDLEDWRL